MKKILIATHNPAKLTELKSGLKELKKLGVKILTLNDLKIAQEPEETGKTFKENAELKARFYSKLTYLPTIADDGGLIIPYLNNEPGVKSRRWLGYDATDEELIRYTLVHLRGVLQADRKAYFEGCICYYDPGTKKVLFEKDRIEGHIADKSYSKRVKGFPFRAVLIVDKFNKYYDELTEREHQQVNHRLKALKRLVKRIKDLIQ